MGSTTRHDISIHPLGLRRWRRFRPVVLIALIALSACGGNDDAQTAGVPAADAGDEAAAATAEAADVAINGEAGDSADEDGGGLDLGVIGRDVIIEMHVTMGSDDIAATVASITNEANRLGGGVAQADVNYGTGVDGGFATLVVKVPPDQVDRLLDGLNRTGEVRSIGQSAQDVTEQLIDLDVRIENARESVESVRRFMDQAVALTDLVTLEGELTRRLTELELLEAQQRNLSDRVALSTVTIEVFPSEQVPEIEQDPGILDALQDGWNAFVAFLFGVVYVLAVLAPFLIVGGFAALAVRWFLRRRQRAATEATPASTGSVSPGPDNTVPLPATQPPATQPSEDPPVE